MRQVRQSIGGLGNLIFKQAFIISQMLEGKIPDVYVQSRKFWAGHEKEIKAYFDEGVGFTDKVALHIRRGDYLKADNFHINLWNTGYYQKALALLPLETEFIVFCKDRQNPEQDAADRAWCLEEVPKFLGRGRNWTFPPEENTEVDDLNLMASCKALIGANSSFSWWGAFLGTHKKLCIFPRQWFVDNIQRTELLDEWVKI